MALRPQPSLAEVKVHVTGLLPARPSNLVAPGRPPGVNPGCP